ncbi:MAG TPA: universal stress protein [Burkholderiales bacterium]|nr:universal stress protein [Burkholderiales bacterium]
MTYKTILVHVDSGKRCVTRLDIAAQLAQRFEAHLVGLHALTVVRLPGYAAAEGGVVVREEQKRLATEYAKQAEGVFRGAMARAGLANAEWRASFDDVLEAVTLNARYADLVVVGQPDPDEGSGVEPDFAHRLVLAAGRPMLVVPYAGEFRTVGKRVLVAWNAGREATRAVTDAIPFLRTADEVTVTAVRPGRTPGHGEVPGADIGLYLSRHGVRVKVAAIEATDIDAGNELLSRAADLSCDLIVMGAYGHSRVSELVLGGVTRTLFDSMTVPVLMSH